MPLDMSQLLGLLAGYLAITAALVAPLYVLVLRRLNDTSSAESERANLDEDLVELTENVEEMRSEVRDIHAEVSRNANRSERNQRHIHQILLGEHNGDDDEMGNPHYRAEYCPLPEECPWHEPESQ